jgi:dTDP-4-amino-4,6-dideoxygalactose transaminase
MNEFSAALGLLQLKHIDSALMRRREIDSTYRESLTEITGITCPPRDIQTVDNYAYFPILVGENYPLNRDDLYTKMRENGVFPRRYFYPLISNFPMYRGLPSARPENLTIANKIANQVICLPIYPLLEKSEQQRVIELIVSN